jgi:hypothetical protein
MLRITVAVFFAFALPAWTQNRVGPPTLASPGPAWDKGFIEDRTYKNSSIWTSTHHSSGT